MGARLRLHACEPFAPAWAGLSWPLAGAGAPFGFSAAMRAALGDLAAADLPAPPARPARHLPGETLYRGLIVENTGSSPFEGEAVLSAPAGASAWVLPPWLQRGRGVLVEERLVPVHELLLKDSRLAGPDDLLRPDHARPEAPVRLVVPPGGFVRLLLKLKTAADGAPYRATLALGPLRQAFASEPVGRAALPESDAWQGLYYGLSPGNPGRYGVEPALFRADLRYLRELGVDTLVLALSDAPEATLRAVAELGFRRVVLNGAAEPGSARRALAAARGAGLEAWLYTMDEPHASEDALARHVARAATIQAAGGRTFTALSAPLAAEPVMGRTLDLANLALWSLPPGLPEARRVLAGRCYYWQAAFERPAVNRFLGGAFAALTGARGAVPFVYRDAYQADSPFASDAAAIYQRRFRHHMLAYPGPHGPLRTLQAEALARGYEDARLIRALASRFPDGHRLFARWLAELTAPAFTQAALQNLYNGRGGAPPGAISAPALADVRERALELLRHAETHGRRITCSGAVSSLEDVRVRYDARRGTLALAPAGARVENFPLALLEGLGPEDHVEAVAAAVFGMPWRAVGDYTLTGV